MHIYICVCTHVFVCVFIPHTCLVRNNDGYMNRKAYLFRLS